ncbi:hypothetical protein CBM2598_U10160 [Cupriavidus taiwanensis]|uniref:Uncharacterized protein n=1 Tax=Cupriavidus taiwanensis TaxID=164546 RepID=A0A7Z7NQ53_9BURK|nr:hypothetical protein CBM2597_U10191 [Cupriavidus taiwanensis]SOZ96350.1 hypothetical protein CBM2598_U10160 [Cupriavidus taiwanensis]SPC25696.1 hypothetical protein CBM2594_U10197 [Cupriavidus taiwanensis]
MSNRDFATMSQAQCVAWYVETVGYDPVMDNPTVSLDQLRRDCAEMYAYATCSVDAIGRGPNDPDFDPCCGVRVYGGTPVQACEPVEREHESEESVRARPRMRM